MQALRSHSIIKRAALASLAAALVTGCSFTAFDDLEKQVPVTQVAQPDGRSSASFGDAMATMVRRAAGRDLAGGALIIVGNGDASLTTVEFGANGDFSNSQADEEDVTKDLDDPRSIHAIATAPAGGSDPAFPGPFVYVGLTDAGKTGLVKLADTHKYANPANDLGAPTDVASFGLSVAAAAFDGSERDDVAVGAKGKVVLWRSDGWPRFPARTDAVIVDQAFSGWPADDFNVIAAGALDTSDAEDEVVVAAPARDRGFVAVIHSVKDCFDNRPAVCKTAIEIPAPAAASGFGSSLLIADVDDDGDNELVIGAPDGASGGAVYIYKLTAGDFAGSSTPSPAKTLPAKGAKRFGAALAFGKLDTKQTLLAVGAPSSDAGGVTGAGEVLLYGSQLLEEPLKEVALAKAAEGGQLGRTLAVMPFKPKPEDPPQHVLVAASRSAVYAFFAGLTNDHKDVRVR